MSALDDFQTFAKQFFAIIAAGVATTALVLVTAVVGLAPPWPGQIVQITAISQLLALIFCFQFLSRSSGQIINRVMAIALIPLIFFSTVYLVVHSLVIFELPDGSVGVKGFICSPHASELYGHSCPFLSRSSIADAEFNADLLWSPVGLTMARISLLIAWIGSFVALVFLVAAFVVYQRRR